MSPAQSPFFLQIIADSKNYDHFTPISGQGSAGFEPKACHGNPKIFSAPSFYSEQFSCFFASEQENEINVICALLFTILPFNI
jgi:hypothetical protein